jgi:hypothetical protein
MSIMNFAELLGVSKRDDVIEQAELSPMPFRPPAFQPLAAPKFVSKGTKTAFIA